MKRLLIAVVLVGALGSDLTAAEPITSKVVHHYTYLSAGYGYLHDIGDVSDAHGAVPRVSFEEGNFVVGVAGGHFWTVDDAIDDTLWGVGGSVGYVFRLAENHINIVPRFGAGYGHVLPDVNLLSLSGSEDWSLFPSISASYAINNRIALGGSYGFGYNLESEDETHVVGAGVTFAVLERVGVRLEASFAEQDDDFDFTGVTAAVELHF